MDHSDGHAYDETVLSDIRKGRTESLLFAWNESVSRDRVNQTFAKSTQQLTQLRQKYVLTYTYPKHITTVVI